MTAKRLKRQFGTSAALFSSCMDEFTFQCTGDQEVSVFARFLAALWKKLPLIMLLPLYLQLHLLRMSHGINCDQM